MAYKSRNGALKIFISEANALLSLYLLFLVLLLKCAAIVAAVTLLWHSWKHQITERSVSNETLICQDLIEVSRLISRLLPCLDTFKIAFFFKKRDS